MLKADELLFLLGTLQDASVQCVQRAKSDGCRRAEDSLAQLQTFVAPHLEEPTEAAWLRPFQVNLSGTLQLFAAERTLNGMGGNVGLHEVAVDAARQAIGTLRTAVLFEVARRLPALAQSVLPRRTMMEGPSGGKVVNDD